jgi:hypothetical protein
MLSTAAIKQARYRERQHKPVRVVARVEIERDRIGAALARKGLIGADETCRIDRVEMALTQWISEVLR